MGNKVKLIAFYLPQYHPIPENDEWWGKGFTEWTNVAKAKPMFKNHYQPHVPADLGFYDLRVPETRIAQAEMAKEYGIDAFCYYHYWFAGKRILERPLNEVVESGEPKFPFCICWANQTWTGIWHGAPNRVLIEQTYPNIDDHKNHFNVLLKIFTDDRYVTIDGNPLFIIYRPLDLPDSNRVTDLWREMAVKAGLKGLHLAAVTENSKWNPHKNGFDASVVVNGASTWVSRRKPIKWLVRQYDIRTGKPIILKYDKIISELTPQYMPGIDAYPCIIPNWDNTPRSGSRGIVFQNSTPELFRKLLAKTIEVANNYPDDKKLIFIKSWNEWAEGNHLEPDLKFGKAYLEAVRDELLVKK